MFDRIRQMFSRSKPNLPNEARDFITKLASSDIWLLAIGVRGTPAMPALSDPESYFSAALQIVAAHRKELSELGDDDSLFAFNYKHEGRQMLPFFSSEECARHFLSNHSGRSNLAIFQPYCLLAGFVTAPQNDKFTLVLDPRSPTERVIKDDERLLLRSLCIPA